jgi:hypothetical protein
LEEFEMSRNLLVMLQSFLAIGLLLLVTFAPHVAMAMKAAE